MASTTVDGLFRERVRRGPDVPFVDCGEGFLTFAELDERSNRAAQALRAFHGKNT